MTIFKKTLVAAALAVGASTAFAFPTFKTGLNTIAFQALENQYRLTASCLAGECLTHDVANDPALYSRVDPTLTGSAAIKSGDIFAGVFFVNSITPGGAANTPGGSGREFTGYFAQEVDCIDIGLGGCKGNLGSLTDARIFFKNPAVDPFHSAISPDKLLPGEMFRLYTDTSPDFDEVAGLTTFGDIAAATSGGAGATFWGSLGLGTTSETYAYTLDNLTIAGFDSLSSKSLSGLDVINKGGSYNLGILNKVNDSSEALVGGVATGPGIRCGPLDLAGVSCTDTVTNADLKKNDFFDDAAGTGSKWFFRANDPVSLNMAVPEPGSLALMGLALAGLGFVRRRKSV